MEVSPSFELIRSRGHSFLFADTVRLPAGAPRLPSPVHFHPQVELVWFRKVTGSVQLEGTDIPLDDRQAVLLPSMQVHAFDTGAGARDWVLLQVEPALLQPFLSGASALAPPRPRILRPDPATADRIDYLCDWLCAIVHAPDRAQEAQQILHLILAALSPARTEGETAPHPAKPLSGPLTEVLQRIHSDPRTAPTLSQAARAARLSDAYFSRLFKSRIGMGYAAYLQMHRLNMAARHLLADGTPVSQVAYRVGFASAAHFSTAFAERFGMSPRRFRQRAGEVDGTGQESERQ